MVISVIGGLDRFNTLTTGLAGKIATVALAIMTTVVTIHVVMRYGFNYSFHWTEEVARNLMVWMTFLFFPTGHKKGMNIAVEFAVAPWAHTAAGKILKILIELLSLTVLSVCLWLSLGLVERGMGSSSQALQITVRAECRQKLIVLTAVQSIIQRGFVKQGRRFIQTWR